MTVVGHGQPARPGIETEACSSGLNYTPEARVLLLSRLTWNRAYPVVRITYGHG